MVKKLLKKARAKYLSLMAATTVAVMSTPLFTNPALAAGGFADVEKKITTGAESFTKSIQNISIVVGAAALAVAIFLSIFTRDDSEIRSNVKWIKRIAVSLAGISCVTLIATGAYNLVN